METRAKFSFVWIRKGSQRPHSSLIVIHDGMGAVVAPWKASTHPDEQGVSQSGILNLQGLNNLFILVLGAMQRTLQTPHRIISLNKSISDRSFLFSFINGLSSFLDGDEHNRRLPTDLLGGSLL
jgi:hypothetical protein